MPISLKAIKRFIILFLIFTALLTIVQFGLDELGHTRIFSGEENPEIAEQFELHSIVTMNSPYYDMFSKAQKVNMLCVGINGGLTDTILFASFDPDRKHVDMISIPRDTYYYREGYNGVAEKKINAAYRKDINNTAKAVSELLFGIPIHYYAVVDLQGVANIVDSMGNVPMDIPFHMRYTDPFDNPPLYIDIPEGHQLLNGETAVQFLRFRHADKGYPEYPLGDVDRQKALQQFLKSAFEQSMGKNLPEVIKSIHENVKSNLDLSTALMLAGKSMGMGAEDFSTYILPGIPETKAPWYIHPDKEAIEALIKEIYGFGEKTDSAADN